MRKDIDFAFTKHPLTGDLAIKKDSNAIQQSLRNLILTSFYERGFNVEAVSAARAMMYKNVDHLTAQTIKKTIKEVIANFEPNITIEAVLVEKYSNGLRIVISYTQFNETEEKFVQIPIQN